VARIAAGLLRSCHPAPILAVSAGVTALAWAAGRGPAGTAWTGLAVASGQLSIGLSNDYLDRAADLAAGRRDKPVAAGQVSAAVVAAAAVIAFACSVPLSLASGWRAGLAQLATVASGWIYNLGLKRTVWSVVPFIPGFGLFPAVVTLGLPGHPWPAWWATTAGALLGMGAHFANVLPDLPADLATGVRGLPQRLGGRISRVVAGLLLGAATAVLAVAPGRSGALGVPLQWAGVVIAIVVAATGLVTAVARAQRPAARYPAMLAVIAAGLLDVVLLVARGGHIH
jgi:4-hydroxybenzoate polyprenyltransferase